MKILLLFFLLAMPSVSFAPRIHRIDLVKISGINPYIGLVKTVGWLETHQNASYVNFEKGDSSIGLLQIRKGMLSDFNKATRKHYRHSDCFNEAISTEIFYWHCSKYGVYEFEKICRTWNGGGRGMSKESTVKYWKHIKQML
jgi:hypothetical protein